MASSYDWLEAGPTLGRVQPEGGMFAHGPGNNSHIREQYVLQERSPTTQYYPVEKLHAWLRYFLGWTAIRTDSLNVNGASYSLHREVPALHPRDTLGAYWGEQVAWHGVGSYLKAGLVSGTMTTGTNSFAHVFRGSAAVESYALQWQQYVLDVTYKSRDYNVFKDSALSTGVSGSAAYDPSGQYTGTDGRVHLPEWLRYCSYRAEPTGQPMKLEGGVLQFVEGTSGSVALAGKPYSNDFILNEKMTGFTLTWHQVPSRWLWQNQLGRPRWDSKLIKNLGKVNDQTFLGFPRGTLLLRTAPKLDLWTSPFTPPSGGIYDREVSAAVYAVDTLFYDVHLTYEIFVPPRFDGALASDTTKRHGHQLVPIRGQTTYAHVTRLPYGTAAQDVAPDATRPSIYEEGDFRETFEYNYS